MARPRAFDIREVLDRAMNIFHRYGYEGATMAELTSAMGLSAPSIYAAFGSKRGLFDAVLDRHSQLRSERFSWVLAAPTAREVAERLLHCATEQTECSDRPSGYLLIQGGLAAGPGNADVPITLAQRRLADEFKVRERFEQAFASGELSTEVDAATLANLITTVFDGLCVKAASGGTAKDLQAIVEQVLSNWDAYIASSDSRPSPAVTLPDVFTPIARGRPREFNESEALDAAMKVFWRKGFEGSSLNDLTTAMAITRPSLYATFGNKESLFFQALDHYQHVHMASGRKALEAPTAFTFVKELLASAVAAQLSPHRPRGCLSVINSMQGSDHSQIVRAEVLRRSAEVHKLIVMRLERAKIDGDLPESQDSEGLARLLASVLQSIATLGAASASADELNALADTTLAIWPQA